MRPATYSTVVIAGIFIAVGIACGGDDDGGGGPKSSGSAPGTVDGGGLGGFSVDGGSPTIPPPSCPDPTAGSTVFYVDGQSGDDAKDGKSEATAWKTINHAVEGSSPVAAGDTVLVKKGVYRERVVIKKSGTEARRILIRPFGQDRVVVDGSDSPGAWSLDSGQVYKAHPSFAVQAVVAEGIPLIPATSRATLAAGQYFFSDGDLYVWTPSGGDPTGLDVGVLAVDDAKTQHAIFVRGSHVTVCGLTARFAGAKGVYMLGDFIRVEQCHIEHNGGIGISTEPDDGLATTDNQIVGNEISDNFLRNWPRCRAPYKGGGWGTGASCQGSPNTHFVRNVVHDNGGEGIVVFGPNATIQGNVVYDNWSVNIYVLNTHDVRVDGNLVFSNEPKLASLTNNDDPDPSDNRCARRLRPIGVATGDEELGLSDTLARVTIVNNLMLGGRYGVTHISEVNGSGFKDVTVAYNTVVLPVAAAAYEIVSGFDLPSNNGNNSGTKVQNNIVYGSGAGTLLSGGDAADGFAGLTIDHNAWFHGSNAKPFRWKNNTYDHGAWAALGGAAHGAGDVVADPSLADPDPALRDPTTKCPKPGAPVLDVGINAGVTTDAFGTPRPQRAGLDLGFCELK